MIVYIPFYNSDMTEGRGPMLPKPFGFVSRSQATEYIDSQPGIMGRKGPWSNSTGGDWEVKDFKILKSSEEALRTEADIERHKLIKQLGPDNCRLLGIDYHREG
jgi:hypothetical protein